jgi:glycosyltransferase involved in cell wall biosynthesis
MTAAIVGLSLVRDEELFVGRVLRNALALCDRVLVADHDSRDRTPEILAALAQEEPLRHRRHAA